MAPPFWVLRCCSCRLFQVQQAKRSRKWSCSVCGQQQALLKIYGQGSGLDCRHHVQKLNLMQGEAEEARGWTSRCVEDSVNDSKYISAHCENNSDQQARYQPEGRAEVSRWSKYLDKDSEDQEDEEDEAGTERQQFCSQRKNTGELRRKHQKSCFSSVVQDCAEENGVFQFAYQAKKVKTTEWKKCLVPDPEDGDAVSGHTVLLAVCESVEPEDSTQTPAACTKPSKWGKFLLGSDKCSENAARSTLFPQEGSRGLGLHSSTAAATAMASRCSEQGGRTLPPGRDFQFNKCGASAEWVAPKLPDPMVPSPSFSAEEDALFKEPPLRRPGSGMTETTGGRCYLDSTRRANTLVKCNPRPHPSNSSCEQLFCTGEEFDDDL